MITRETAKQLMDEVNRVLREHISDEYGVKVVSGRFDANVLTLKVEIVAGDKEQRGDSLLTSDYVHLMQYARGKWGVIGVDDLEKVYKFSFIGECKLVGYRAKSSKYPFIVKRLSDGKLYKVGENDVRLAAHPIPE